MNFSRKWLGVLALGGLLGTTTAWAATVGLLRDIETTAIPASSDPVFLGSVGGQAIFTATSTGQFGARLWRSDGTSAGTVAFAGSTPFNSRYAQLVGGRLVFFGQSEAGYSAVQLWAADGTDAGTREILALGEIGYEQRWLASSATRGYFIASNNLSYDANLYVTDGTATGTRRLTSDRRVSPGAIMTASDGIYFVAESLQGGDSALWFSDGTVAGTRSVHTLATLGLEALSSMLWIDGNALVVSARSHSIQAGVFSLDLVAGSAGLLTDHAYGPNDPPPVTMAGIRYFVMEQALWRSDGSATGTYLLTSGAEIHGVRWPLAAVGDRIVFARSGGSSRSEIWASDGTLPGTQVLMAPAPGLEGWSSILAYTDQRVFLLAGDGVSTRFWVTDGTLANTRTIPQSGSAAYGFHPMSSGSGVVAGDRVYLQIEEGSAPGIRLWSTDLSGIEAVNAGPGGAYPISSGHRLFYSAPDPSGNEPWVSDGTPAGTFRLRDIAVSGQTASSEPGQFTKAGNQAFFSAATLQHGRELWSTDGTESGTRLVRDLVPGLGSGNPSDLQAAGSLVYFVTRDHARTPTGFWRSDGTEAGTFQLLGIPVRANSQCGPWLAEWNGRVWFLAEPVPGERPVLYSTDGTMSGTREELALPDEAGRGPICSLVRAAQSLVFVAEFPFESTPQLWRTDATVAGTFRLSEIRLEGRGSRYGGEYLDAVNGIVYLLADHRRYEGNDTGIELWRTDGTEAGTSLVADLTQGLGGASQFAMEPHGDGVVFAYESMEPSGPRGLFRVAAPGEAPVLIKEGAVRFDPLVSTGESVYFSVIENDTESLWVSDGSASETREAFNAGQGRRLLFDTYAGGDGLLYMIGPVDDAGTGDQLWVTSGAMAPHQLSNFMDNCSFGSEIEIFNGRAVFSYSDQGTGMEPWIVTNLEPQAVADTATVRKDGSVLVDVLANDSDADSASSLLTISVISLPSHGTVTLESAGVRYTPAAGYTGTDNFQYRIADELGLQSRAVNVTLTVTAPPGSGGGGGAVDLGLLALLAWAWRAGAAKRWYGVPGPAAAVRSYGWLHRP